MTYASTLTLITAVLLAPLPALHAADGPEANGPSKPNIVIILADDLGYSDFGCYGGEIDTPNIDRLAENGLRFASYYSEAKCNPSRQSLLTGKYAIRAFSGRDATIAECLAQGGYSRSMAGKWDMVADKGGDSRQTPQARGFEHFFGTPMGCGSYCAPIKLTRDGKPAEQESMAPGFYYTDAITDNAVQSINAAPQDNPLFLYAAYTAPHWPLHAREEDIAKYKGRFKAGWDQLREERLVRMKTMGLVGSDVKLSPREKNVPAWLDEKHPEWKQRLMEVYAAQIECMDRGVGRILQALDKTGRRDNTLIIVTSDNGACAEEYSPDRPGNYLSEKTRDGRPLRVGKRAVRQGDWKLVYPRGGPWELYQIRADPVEANDLATTFPERVEQMSARWNEWFSLQPKRMRRAAQDADSEATTPARGREPRPRRRGRRHSDRGHCGRG